MLNLALFGDSIIDNGAYIPVEASCVSAQLRNLLSDSVRVDLYAVDGARTVDVYAQIPSSVEGYDYAVLSVGGNDALHTFDLLSKRVDTMGQALAALSEMLDLFEIQYAAIIRRLQIITKKIIVLLIYNGNFIEAELAVMVRQSISAFNDRIVQIALGSNVAMIDLRALCTGPDDYANAIEPSEAGGQKIALAIAAHILGSKT